MKNKSKFITFLLSFIPGLSHFYLGFADRAIIFLMVFCGVILGTVGLMVLTNTDNFVAILVFALPIIWLVALIDAFSLRNSLGSLQQESLNGEMGDDNLEEMRKSNKRTIAMALSIIPGAGHMYLGYQTKGLIIMGGFFFTIFFMGWLRLSLFLFVLPLIWFYSFFDVLHSVNGTGIKEDKLNLEYLKIKPEWVGITLIVIGILIILEKILYTLIPYEIQNYIQTSIVALTFIIGGIKLLNKAKKDVEGDEKCQKDK